MGRVSNEKSSSPEPSTLNSQPSTLHPQPSTQTAILVCEQEPYWTPELQRQFQSSGLVVRSCRTWKDMIELSQLYSRVVQVVHWGERVAECLAGLGERIHQTNACPLILIATDRFTDWEWLLRDAGVQAFFSDQLTGKDLARCCRRWLLP